MIVEINTKEVMAAVTEWLRRRGIESASFEMEGIGTAGGAYKLRDLVVRVLVKSIETKDPHHTEGPYR